jgi:hypothetical protein
MKKHFVHNNFVKVLSVILVSCLIFTINSCKKSIAPEQLLANKEVNLTLLQSIYKNDTTGTALTISMINNRDVKWDRIYFQQREKSRVMEFDIAADSHIWTMSPNPANYFNKSSAVFLDFNDGTKFNFYMKVIEDHTDTTKQSLIRYVHYNSVPAGFNGEVMFYSLTNQFINGYKYTNGKIKGEYLPAKPVGTGGGNIQSIGPKVNTMYVETYCFYDYLDTGWIDPNSGVYNPVQSTGSLVCYNNYFGSMSEGGANGDGGSVIGDPGSSGGGDANSGSAQQPSPCNTPGDSGVPNAITVTGGHAVVQQVAGCPPVVPPPAESLPPVQQVTNNLKSPCLEAALSKVTSASINNLISNFYNNFAVGPKSQINIEIDEQSNLTSTRTDGSGIVDIIPARGTHNPNTNNYVITLNNGYLTDNIHNMSQEVWGQIIIHEILHILIYENQPAIAAQGTLYDHAFIFKNLITPTRDLLMSSFGISQDDAIDLALNGLGDLWQFSDFATLCNSVYGRSQSQINTAMDDYSKNSKGIKCQ